MNQLLEEGYQRYLTELELARGDQIDGRRFLSEGKVEVLQHHASLHYSNPPIFCIIESKC